MKKNILIIQHSDSVHPAALCTILPELGLDYSVYKIFENHKKFTDFSYTGMIILGGGMSVNDVEEFPWIINECAQIKKEIEKGTPILGICLGSQLIAKSLGKKITRHHTPEIGWWNVDQIENDPFFKIQNHAQNFFQWHFDTFELPDGATLLASSNVCKNQAYRHGQNCYAVQYHPEANHQLVSEWTKEKEDKQEVLDLMQLGHKYIQTVDDQIKDCDINVGPQNTHLLDLCRIFL